MKAEFELKLRLFKMHTLLLLTTIVSMVACGRVKRGVNGGTWLWENKQVFYSLSPSYTRYERNLLEECIDEFRQNTCVRFINLNSKTEAVPDNVNYIHFVRVPGSCEAYEGWTDYGKQEINLGENCMLKSTILHELMHTLGFAHEHTRPDRDQFIAINKSNSEINDDKEFWMQYGFAGGMDVSETPFDFRSIMMYTSDEFGIHPGTSIDSERVITIKNNTWDSKSYSWMDGFKDRLSPYDVYEVNAKYQCNVCRDFEDYYDCKDFDCNGEWKTFMSHLCKKTCGLC